LEVGTLFGQLFSIIETHAAQVKQWKCIFKLLHSCCIFMWSVIGWQVVKLSMPCDRPVSDNEWHILTIKRRAKELEARVDDCRPATS